MRDRLREYGQGKKEGIVHFATSAETIQAALTGLSVAVLTAGLDNFALLLDGLLHGLTARLPVVPGVGVPVQTYRFVLIVLAVRAVWWVRNNPDEYRETVENKTGEEAADDDVE